MIKTMKYVALPLVALALGAAAGCGGDDPEASESSASPEVVLAGSPDHQEWRRNINANQVEINAAFDDLGIAWTERTKLIDTCDAIKGGSKTVVDATIIRFSSTDIAIDAAGAEALVELAEAKVCP